MEGFIPKLNNSSYKCQLPPGKPRSHGSSELSYLGTTQIPDGLEGQWVREQPHPDSPMLMGPSARNCFGLKREKNSQEGKKRKPQALGEQARNSTQPGFFFCLPGEFPLLSSQTTFLGHNTQAITDQIKPFEATELRWPFLFSLSWLQKELKQLTCLFLF